MRRLLLVLLAACGGPAQVRRTAAVEVVVVAPRSTLESGWALGELNGTASLSGLRCFEGDVLLSRRFNPLDLLIAPAYAHPGHYEPGAARLELLEPLVLDLSTREPIPWGVANAVTGHVGSADLLFGEVALRVKGTATKGARTVRFDTGPLSVESLRPIPFDHELTSEPGSLRVELDLGVLLSRIDFDAAGVPGPDGVVAFDPASVAFNAFDRGATDTASWRFTWRAN